MLTGKVKLAETLKSLRGKRTRAEIEAISGVSAASIQAIEDGRNPNPTIQTLLALSETYQVSILDIFRHAYPEITEPEKIIERDPLDVNAEHLAALIRGFARASDAKKAIALTLLAPLRGDIGKHFRALRVPIDLDTAYKIRDFLGELEKTIIAARSETS